MQYRTEALYQFKKWKERFLKKIKPFRPLRQLDLIIGTLPLFQLKNVKTLIVRVCVALGPAAGCVYIIEAAYLLSIGEFDFTEKESSPSPTI
jgi:hypothetical protein